MKRMLNEPTAFKDEMIDGYCAAFGRYVRRVPGASGVMAVGAPAAGKVAVVVGGGSGHYPAFYGLVGEGMADGAAIGDIFTSPSGEQAYRVGKAVDGGAGILFTFGNYSGDVMNFGMAETRLRAEGIDAAMVLATDDVLSAPKTEAAKRRGIAGAFYVFKTAGASAARGDDLRTVEALTRRANSRVRTAGVAFAGCTIPGQSEPLFTVETDRMEVGLGIHGEPGVRVSEHLPAREIARLLVESLLDDAPPVAGNRAAVMLNGLGGTKYEEMFVLYSGISPLLERAGLEVVDPQVGEFVTSLDMAGCSLTLFWLDDELEPLHDAYAACAAFSRFGPEGIAGAGRRSHLENESTRPVAVLRAVEPEESESIGSAGEVGEAGVIARTALRAALAAMEVAEAELGRLDAAAGDGDHGLGMVRGFRVATEALGSAENTARLTLTRAGAAFMDAAGGASGALIGAWITAIGTALPVNDAEVDAASVAAAMDEGLATVQRLGQAQAGDKTLIDTLQPFGYALREAVGNGAPLSTAWTAALPAAQAGMFSTVEMISRRGRASRLGERSRGYQDPGATSVYYVLRAVGEVLAAAADDTTPPRSGE